MKNKYLLFVIAVFLFANYLCYAKEMVIFNAYSQSTQRDVVIDSIVVTNLATNTSFTSTADTIYLDLQYTAVNDNPQEIIPHQLAQLKSDNPFENSTEFSVSLLEASNVSMELFDIMGKIWTNNTMFLGNGSHNFQLNALGLNPGVYFLSIRGNFNQQTLKLIKLGAAGGSEPTINYLSSSAGALKTTANNGKNSIQAITSLYSFDCYAKSYYHQKTTHDFAADTTTTINLTFALFPVNKYNISSGHIGISGLNYNHKITDYYHYPPNYQTFDTSFADKAYSLDYLIQNVYGPNNALESKFLDCLNYIEDSLIVDFCDRTYQESINNGIYSSKSVIVRIAFNKNSTIIDSLKFTFYNFNHICCNNDIYTTENEYTYINLYNIPFTIDSSKNISAQINGKDIVNFLNIQYSSSVVSNHESTNQGNNDDIISLPSVSDDAYIRITLQQ